MEAEIRVLVVDEDPDILDLTETFLERADDDLAVRTVESGTAALETIESEQIDCVVSDYRMPEMDGFELHERMQDVTAVPFILYTASGDQKTTNRTEEAGITGMIQKGAGTEHYDELAGMIIDAVDESRDADR